MPAAATEVTGYESLCDTLRELSALQGIDALVGWDEMVMMPQGSAKSRAMQKKVLAGIVHERCTDPKIGEQLKQVEASDCSLGEAEAAVVREAKRDYRKATLVTKELAERRAVLQSEGYQAWLQAREQNDWSVFAPKLKELVQVEREVAAAVDPDKSVYDSALDNYEKGFTSARIDDIFAQLKEGVVPLIAELKGGTRPDDAWLQGEWDVKAQAALCDGIVKDLGYDVSHGRLDVSVHPFTCSMHPDDVRMTTRFKPHDVMEGITGAVHECGHALYEQGRNPEYDGLPTSAALSLGVHESQSLLWERMVALTPAFCRYLLPKVQAALPEFGKGKTAEDLYAAMNTVKEPSYVRVEADEVTYPLHVILRYEIERALLNGELDVDDVPRVWNEKMEGYLGCTPPDHKLGCLQDMHWAMGALGYFTTYTLGAMYAAQIFFTAKKDLPNLEADIEAGKFSELREWLRERVHKLGSVPPSGDDLMRAVTGEPLNVSIFLDHLRAKYRALYKL